MLDALRTWLARRSTRDLLLDVLLHEAAIRRHVEQVIPMYLDRLEKKLMTNLDTLQAAVQRTGNAVASAVVALADQRTKIAALQEAVNAGQLDQGALAAMTASLDAASDRVAQALAPVVADPEVPTEEPVSGAPVEEPPAQNPDTADPADVPGSVPAGEPLPDGPDGAVF